VLRVLRNSKSVTMLDITGGAPELNEEFRYLVTEARKLGVEVPPPSLRPYYYYYYYYYYY
jgi:hypothetical protein